MKKLFTLLFFIVQMSSIQTVQAQYHSAIGVQLGKFCSGVSYKNLFGRENNYGIEFIAGYTREAKSGYMGKLFFVKHKDLHNSMLRLPLNFVLGLGGHVGYFKEDFYAIKEGYPVYYKDNTISAGVDAQIGFELNSRRSPITVSVLANPYYSFLNPGPEVLDVAVSVRYIIN